MQAELSEEMFDRLAKIEGITPDAVKRAIIRRMPKTDLHVHGEAGFLMDIALAREIATRNGLPFPEDLVEKVNDKERWKYRGTENFMIFIGDFLTVSSLIRKPQDIEDVCYAFYRHCYENNVVFALPGISWVQCKDRMTMQEFHEAYNRALLRGMNDFGDVTLMRFRYYLERHLNAQTFDEVLREFLATPNPFVTTVGLAGDENKHPLTDFDAVYQKLQIDRKKADKPWYFLTAHMEKFSDPKIIQESLALLDWIAHGWMAAENNDVLAVMKEKGIVFEVCPLSDTHCFSDVVPTVASHINLKKLIVADRATLNSDDPAFFGDIGEVYWQVFDKLNVSFDQLLQCTSRGLNPVSLQTLDEMHQYREPLFNDYRALVWAGELKISFFDRYLNMVSLLADVALDNELARRLFALDLKTPMEELLRLSFAIPSTCNALKNEFSGLMKIKVEIEKTTAEIKKNMEVTFRAFNKTPVFGL